MILDIKTNKDLELFNDFCNKSNKSHTAIILYYANWCSACNSMKSEWNRFEKKMRKNPKQKQNKLNIFKFEADDMNELMHIPTPEVLGYPTIRKLKITANRKNKTPAIKLSVFNEKRDLKEFEKFSGIKEKKKKSTKRKSSSRKSSSRKSSKRKLK